MVGMALAKSLYTLPTWTRTVRPVAEHAALRKAIGGAPSVDACYRFTRKLREHKGALDSCIASVLASLHAELAEFGNNVAIDGSDLQAYANGQPFVYNHGPERKRFSDPDASWGHRSAISTRKGGGFYGNRIHAAVCTSTGLPVSWTTHTARDAEVPVVPALLDKVAGYGIAPRSPLLTAATTRPSSMRPASPATFGRSFPFGRHRSSRTARLPLRRANMAHRPSPVRTPSAVRQSTAAPRRVLPGECVDQGRPTAHAHPSRDAAWKDLYRSRGGVEREFGRWKHEWALLPLRVRRIERVALHVDLTILARLAVALSDARAVPLAA